MRSPSIVLLAAALGAMTLGSSAAYAQELIAQKALSLDVAFAIARVPIRTGNDFIGAIGVRGAPGGDKDQACSNAGIAKVASKLK